MERTFRLGHRETYPGLHFITFRNVRQLEPVQEVTRGGGHLCWHAHVPVACGTSDMACKQSWAKLESVELCRALPAMLYCRYGHRTVGTFACDLSIGKQRGG